MTLTDADREAIRQLVDEAPPLTDDQIATLTSILKPVAKPTEPKLRAVRPRNRRAA